MCAAIQVCNISMTGFATASGAPGSKRNGYLRTLDGGEQQFLKIH